MNLYNAASTEWNSRLNSTQLKILNRSELKLNTIFFSSKFNKDNVLVEISIKLNLVVSNKYNKIKNSDIHLCALR
jgi:hypothetical protein